MKHDFRLTDFSHETLCSHSSVLLVTVLWVVMMKSEKKIFISFLNGTMHNIKASKLYRHSCVFSEWWWKHEIKHQVLKFLLDFSFHTCKWPEANISSCSYDNPLQFQDALYHLRGKISFSRTGKGQSKCESVAYWDQVSPCRTSVHPQALVFTEGYVNCKFVFYALPETVLPDTNPFCV